MTHFRKTTRVLIATLTIAALALVVRATPPVHAAGLINCLDLSGRGGACYESVWAHGDQFSMTFPTEANPVAGTPPSDQVDNFYVIAPQTATPQGTLPFAHDHVVGNVPAQNHGSYLVHLHGFFVLCSAEGITSGGCVPTMSTIPGLGTLPVATTVNGQPLTAVAPIESPANAGLLTLVDTGAVFVAIINPST
jgi:hypothetical protein